MRFLKDGKRNGVESPSLADQPDDMWRLAMSDHQSTMQGEAGQRPVHQSPKWRVLAIINNAFHRCLPPFRLQPQNPHSFIFSQSLLLLHCPRKQGSPSRASPDF